MRIIIQMIAVFIAAVLLSCQARNRQGVVNKSDVQDIEGNIADIRDTMPQQKPAPVRRAGKVWIDWYTIEEIDSTEFERKEIEYFGEKKGNEAYGSYYVNYYLPINSPDSVRYIIEENLKWLVYHYLFNFYNAGMKNYSMDELLKRELDSYYSFFQNDTVCSFDNKIYVDTDIYQNEEIISIIYYCENSMGGSLNAQFAMCYNFKSDGEYLYFDDILPEENREAFFRIANDEWEANREKGKTRWYNPFSKFQEQNEVKVFRFDNEFYQEQGLQNKMMRNFWYSRDSLILYYNCYDIGCEEYGKTKLSIPNSKIKGLIRYL
ncbi:hypothetical protein LJB78_00950 [Bacteroidales bacterium OttesenSCG-928-J16]|nr:hypothetical protein [Bacteroidales bacterium OttesenSCG-928-J16]